MDDEVAASIMALLEKMPDANKASLTKISALTYHENS
jgi:hypothetical protein